MEVLGILFIVENLIILTTIITSILSYEKNNEVNEIYFNYIKSPKLKDFILILKTDKPIIIEYEAEDFKNFIALSIVLDTPQKLQEFIEENANLRIKKLINEEEQFKLVVYGKGKRKNNN